ncbi:AbrB family transcriptional regulator [Aurantimonas sp. HBX-1]|uniref:AbrB family transcriptional regulator n=1 Tax=Aurantimonas sp. HBX-1 TaxID=2906072 RepID=UPI001F361452|nr:AbrB family transcriptional regulator [Aurantimonas sp. HBX-1]UIJ70928.1 AbrB family transcriptional regulator [Aurantimonas sp. HBX-1]
MKAVSGKRIVALAATLVLAALAGAAGVALGFPVPWLLGPVLAVSAASITGLDTRLPVTMRSFAFFVLGIQAGSGVTPAVLEQLALWPASFAIQMVGVVFVIAASYAFLRRVLGWDHPTSLFASMPGALSFVVAAAAQTRADMTRVAVVQSVRLLMLIGALTPTLAWLQGDIGLLAPLHVETSLPEYGLMFALCGIGAVLGHFSRLPGGMMLGALIASAILHGGGFVTAPIPPTLAAFCLVLLGAVIGARLRGIGRRELASLLPASVGSFVIGLGLSAVAAAAAILSLGLAPAKVALAYAPGALEALTVLAFQFDVDPAYVAAHHVVRFMAIALLVPLLATRVARRGLQVEARTADVPSGVDRGEDGR